MRARVWASICAWWILSRLLVVLTAVVVQYALWPAGAWRPALAHRPLALLTAWGGRWYRMVAQRGYLVIPHHQSDTAFFPLYPALLRVGRALGLSADTAGLLVANLALLVALVALYELVRSWTDERTACRAAGYAAIFPVGYVFSMVYPEALVLAAMAVAGVLAARGRWTGAAVAAAVAALTRPEALLLVLPLGALAAREWPTADVGTRLRAATAVAAAPAALAGVCLYEWRTFGDALAFSTAQRSWGRAFELGGPARAVEELVRSVGTPNAWLFRDAAPCVVYLLLLVVAARFVPCRVDGCGVADRPAAAVEWLVHVRCALRARGAAGLCGPREAWQPPCSRRRAPHLQCRPARRRNDNGVASMAVIRRVLLPFAGAAAAACAIAVAALALLRTLPQPTRGDRVGVKLLQFLHERGGRRSRITIGGRSLAARCRRLSHRRNLVQLSDGSSFVVSGSHIRAWRAPSFELAGTSEQLAIVRAAEADLAGSYRLYAAELASQLEAGKRVTEHAVRLRGRRVYEIALACERPRVTLIVDGRTLRPPARFESAALEASAVLPPPKLRRGPATC